MMKAKSLPALAIILGIALSTSAFAQGRHDEKPHGMSKPATEAQESKDARTATGGRHDEGGTTHRARKAQAKDGNSKAADDKVSK